jgi:membrane-associated phospholipid phosphatase
MENNNSLEMNASTCHFLTFRLFAAFITTLFLNNTNQFLYAIPDTIQINSEKKFCLKREILPLSLIGLGTALNFSNAKYYINQKIGNTTNIRLDNYLQFAPIAELYIADLAGIKHKNSVWNQTKYLAISELISSIMVESVKYVAKVKGPNGGTLSFPSGHTVIAFTSATVLFEEFRDDNLPVALSGYAFSTATGILRMTNNDHWISDVLASAGIGILVTHLVYYWEPLKNWDPLKITDKLGLTPDLRFQNKYPLLGLTIHLK